MKNVFALTYSLKEENNLNKHYSYAYRTEHKNGVTTHNLIAWTEEQHKNAYSDETLEWFNKMFGDFGRTVRKDFGWCLDWFSCCATDFIEERVYYSLDNLIDAEGLTQTPLATWGVNQKSYNNNAYIILKDNVQLGLRSYDELVAIFKPDRGIEVKGWFSQTTAKHIKSYLEYNALNAEFTTEIDVSKNKLKDGAMFYFKSNQ